LKNFGEIAAKFYFINILRRSSLGVRLNIEPMDSRNILWAVCYLHFCIENGVD